MKSFVLKLVALLLIVMALVPLLEGCNKAKENPDETSADGGETKDVLEYDRDIELFKDQKCEYVVVRPDLAEKAIIDAALEVQILLTRLTGVQVKITDDSSYDVTKKEIVIGNTKYPESTQVLHDMKINQYGACVIGEKIIINGYTTTTIKKAVTSFNSLIKKSVQVEEDESVSVIFNTADLKVGEMSYWLGDIPALTFGTYSGCFDLENDNVQVYYTNVNTTDFYDYGTVLEASGFSKYQSNQIGDNLFSTYVSAAGMVHLEYFAYNHSLSIITDSLASNVLPEPEPYDASDKVTENTLGIFSLDYSHRDVTDGNGMCYVITLEDGRFVIMDGGYAQDAENLYRYLVDNNKREDGIHIATWFLSHSHGDHYGCFNAFSTLHGKDVSLNYVVANPTSKYMYKLEKDYNGFLTENLGSVMKLFGGSPKFVKAHTGQVFTFCNVEFEILYTHENLYPHLIQYGNDASTVVRMKANGKTVLFTADAEFDSVETMVSMYGATLKSDILQVNHHGYSGGSQTFFSLVAPKIAMWTTSQEAFEIRIQDTWKRAENKYIVDMVGIENTLVADDKCKLLPMNYTSLADIRYYSYINSED